MSKNRNKNKNKNPTLSVMFDTNVLYTQVASDLVRHKVRSLITENSSHTDLNINWHLPKVVIGERRHQMLKQARDLLPSMQKMENLLGHKFGIGEDTLSFHVNKAIDASIQELNLQTSDIDVDNIDWHELIDRSINRVPPFEDGEKEKGFRDSVIAHSFLQLVKDSPITPSVCRLVLVSEDKKLREYVSEKTETAKNVRILSGLDELESLINTLVSLIPEDLATELTKKASLTFIEPENEKGLYYKSNIQDKIKEDFSEVLTKSPLMGLRKVAKKFKIQDPVFIKKERSKIYWTSPIKVEFDLFHYERVEDEEIKPFLWENFKDALLSKIELKTNLDRKKVIDLTAHDLFEVHWKTTLSAAQNLTAPKLDKIVYLGNDVGD
ncbi:PIN domain-containing protein [Microbulbifer sp. ANSA002]|uniref:PIN domain-containing protein n=1 Tax=unclassified Microbulbifer TaxID=2619833 RepID=UPI004041187D